MRFNLAWLLALTTYVAIAAAAIGTQSPALADVAFALSSVACGHAVQTVWQSKGERRAVAAGFLLGAAAHVACLCLAPRWAPSTIALDAAGYVRRGEGLNLKHSGIFLGNEVMLLDASPELAPLLRTANCLGAIATGLLGSCGAAVARRLRPRGQP